MGAQGRAERSGRAGGPAGRAAGVRRASGARPVGRPGRVTGCVAGQAGCALGALSLFSARFDSVFFLSHFLDIVREPGS